MTNADYHVNYIDYSYVESDKFEFPYMKVDRGSFTLKPEPNYYVNEYADGVFGMAHTSREECKIPPNEYCPIPIIGVWHIRFKSNDRN